MSIVLAAAKRDPRKYKWLEYLGRKATFDVEDTKKDEYDLALVKGDLFGIRHYKGHAYLVDSADLSLQLKLKPLDAERIINNSRGYVGKIGKYNVEAYEGGKDKPQHVKLPPGDVVGIPADSSAFRKLAYSAKDKALYVQFRSGAVWQYSKVSPNEAAELEHAQSQGRYFSLNIKGVKDEVQLDTMPKN